MLLLGGALPALAASSWSSAGRMHVARVASTATLLNDGRVLVVGGETRGGGTAELYDPRTRSWLLAPDPPPGFSRSDLAFKLGNSRVLLIANSMRVEASARPASVTSFDSELGWEPVPDPTLGGGDSFAVAQLDADNLLLAGGNDLAGPVAQATVYSARANAWFPLPNLLRPRSGAQAAPLGNGAAIIAGGWGPGGIDVAPLDSAEIFDGAAGWRAAASYPGLSRVDRLLAIGPSRVLAIIGGGSPQLVLYDADANSWTLLPPRPHAGESPAVLLTGGRVLFAGAWRVSTAQADLYDPATGSWSELQPMNEPRLLPSLVTLSDGGVLAIGGVRESGPLPTTEIFGGRAPAAQAGQTGIPEQGWIASGLLLVLAGLLALLGFGATRRPRRLGAGVGRLLLQAGGAIVATWSLFAFAHLLVNARSPGNAAIANFFYQPLGQVIWEAAARSLTLIAYATLGATIVGLGAAIAVVSLRERRLVGLELAGALLLVIPTFLLAILVQEFQAQLYGKTGLIIAAGYGEVNGVQVFWASLVLGIRPATYLYRHGRAVLERESGEDYVRTAEAKGLEWREVVRHHLLRAGGGGLVATWTNSFRLMIGSLPLVEYFFGYPGLGRILVQSIGITYGVRPVVFRGDLAIGLVVTLALILILVEAMAGALQRWLDPRVRDLRSAA